MADQNPIKTKLFVKLFAGSQLVAESEDSQLWQKILLTISNGGADAKFDDQKGASKDEPSRDNDYIDRDLGSDSEVQRFAKILGISTEQLVGACNPEKDPPYISLDEQNWESFLKKIPARGTGAVSRLALAATLLCLWFKHAKIEGQPSVADAQEVLKTIGITDNNPNRALKNTSWLQYRNKGISINPAEMSQAISVAKTYCVRNASKE